ncbi:hypothetical protein ACWNYI_00110 [Candidatus Vidania fulgoroideorum]
MKVIKMHSCGNSFVIYKNFYYKKKKIHKISNKFYGEYFDQEIIIKDYFKKIFYIKIYNNDGSEAFNCINGLRCLSKFIFKKLNINKINLIVKYNVFSFYKKKNYIISKLNNVINNLKSNSINFKFKIYYIKNNKFIYYIKNTYNKKYLISLNIGNKHIIVKKNILNYDKFIKKENILSNYNLTSFNSFNKFIKTKENGVGFTNSCGSASSCLFYLYYKNFKKKNFVIFNKYGNIKYYKKLNKVYLYSKSNYIKIILIKL